MKSIHYNNFTIRIVDSGVQKKRNYCSTGLHSMATFDSTDPYSFSSLYTPYMEQVPIILVTCATPVNSTLFIETASCLNSTTIDSSKYNYFMVGSVTSFDLKSSCEVTQMLLTSPSINNSFLMSCESICNEIVNGFELSWFTYGCQKCKSDEVCDTSYDSDIPPELKTIKCSRHSSGTLIWILSLWFPCPGENVIHDTYVSSNFIIRLPYANPNWLIHQFRRTLV